MVHIPTHSHSQASDSRAYKPSYSVSKEQPRDHSFYCRCSITSGMYHGGDEVYHDDHAMNYYQNLPASIRNWQTLRSGFTF